MTLDPLAPMPDPVDLAAIPPRQPLTLRQRAKDAAKAVAAGASSAFAWSKAKIETLGVPTVSRNDVLADVFAYLDAHGLNEDIAFDHWKASVTIARAIVEDVGHVATKVVAIYPPTQRMLLIAFAVEEVLGYLAKHGLTGANVPDGPSIAGKIEPKADGPKGAA